MVNPHIDQYFQNPAITVLFLQFMNQRQMRNPDIDSYLEILVDGDMHTVTNIKFLLLIDRIET